MTPRKPPTSPAERTDRDRLVAVRDRLEAVLADQSTPPRDLATVAREYRILLERLGALTAPGVPSPADEIAARRAARGAS